MDKADESSLRSLGETTDKLLEALLKAYREGRSVAVTSIVSGIVVLLLTFVTLTPFLNPPPYQFVTMALVAVVLNLIGSVTYFLLVKLEDERYEKQAELIKRHLETPKNKRY